MPVWMQPVWKYVVKWFVLWLREQKVQAELREVDKQVLEINEQWTQIEDAERTAGGAAQDNRVWFEAEGGSFVNNFVVAGLEIERDGVADDGEILIVYGEARRCEGCGRGN
jgi:hypothetical protein